MVSAIKKHQNIISIKDFFSVPGELHIFGVTLVSMDSTQPYRHVTVLQDVSKECSVSVRPACAYV